jgi:hypothetical protein
MRDSLRPRRARVPRTSSFRKLTRSRAISTASRSLDAPSDALASSRSRGSSQNALRTFPIRVARAPDVVTRDRDDRRPVFESRRLDVVGTGPHFSVRHITAYRTYAHPQNRWPSTSGWIRSGCRRRARKGGHRAAAENRRKQGVTPVSPGTRKVVGATGFEPATSRSQSERSTRLSHAPTLRWAGRSLSHTNAISRAVSERRVLADERG